MQGRDLLRAFRQAGSTRPQATPSCKRHDPRGRLPTLSCLCLRTFQTLGLGSEAEKTGGSEKGQEANPTRAALWGLELSQQTGQDFTASWSPPTDFQPPALPLRPAKHQASLRRSHLCPLWPLPTSTILPKAREAPLLPLFLVRCRGKSCSPLPSLTDPNSQRAWTLGKETEF